MATFRIRVRYLTFYKSPFFYFPWHQSTAYNLLLLQLEAHRKISCAVKNPTVPLCEDVSSDSERGYEIPHHKS